MVWLYFIIVVPLCAAVLCHRCYVVGVQATEERWRQGSAYAARDHEAKMRDKEQEIADLMTALAPYGEQLCAKLPREGHQPITLPFYEFLAVRASFGSCQRFVDSYAAPTAFYALAWRAHRLLQGPRP